MDELVKRYDPWIREPSSFKEERTQPSTLFVRTELNLSDPRATIFPPTYARKDKSRGHPYDINKSANGTFECSLDSVGSQGNRMAKIFERPSCRGLLPNAFIETRDGRIPVFQVAHRLADGAFFAVDGKEEIRAAFDAFLKGNPLPIAELDPLFFVGGGWDSRGTLARFTRTVDASITAYDVAFKTRSAQYVATVDRAGSDIHEDFGNGEDVDAEGQPKHPLAEWGFLSVPSVDKHGGISVGGPILHLVHVSLSNIRKLSVPGDPAKTLALRRYVLGLSLLEVLAYSEYDLRSGCQLFPVGAPVISLLPERTPVSLDVDEIYDYTKRAAEDFGVTGAEKKFVLREESIRRIASEAAARKEEEAKKKEERKAKKKEKAAKKKETPDAAASPVS
jgi:CRISPR-associated protein Csb1